MRVFLISAVFVLSAIYSTPSLEGESEPLNCGLNACQSRGCVDCSEEDCFFLNWYPHLVGLRPPPEQTSSVGEEEMLIEPSRSSFSREQANDLHNLVRNDKVLIEWAYAHFLNITRVSDKGRAYFEDYYAPVQILFSGNPPEWKSGQPAPIPRNLLLPKPCAEGEELPEDPQILFPHVQGSQAYQLLGMLGRSRDLKNYRQADSHGVLVDQDLEPVYYEALVNRSFYTQVKAKGLTTVEGIEEKVSYKFSLDPGASILMTAWRILEPSGNESDVESVDKTKYFTAEAYIFPAGKDCVEKVTAALVGMNIAAQVGNLGPSQLWAAFEHVDNAPDCKSTPDSTRDWSFYDGETDCGDHGSECNYFVPGRANRSTNVCRRYPWGEVSETPSAQNCLKSLNFAMQELSRSERFHGVPWGFYKGIGVLWMKQRATDQRVEDQRGSLLLSSSVLETYRQHRNCIACHDLRPRGECLTDRESFLYQNNIFSLVCDGIESSFGSK